MRTLKSLDPAYLLHRLESDQIVGVLADRDLAELTDTGLMLVDGAVAAGTAPQAYGVVALRKGVRFDSGEAATAKLGDKLDATMRAHYEKSEAPVWFHPIRAEEVWQKTKVVKGLTVPEREAEPDAASLERLDDDDLAQMAVLVTRAGEDVLVDLVKAEYGRRGLELPEELEKKNADAFRRLSFGELWGRLAALSERDDSVATRDLARPMLDECARRGAPSESLRLYKQIFGYPAGKSALAARLVAMMPSHKTYVEPFVGSGAVLFKKEKSEVEVVNDLDPEVAEAWRNLAKLTNAQIEALKKKNWVGNKDTYKRVHGSTPSDPVEKLYKFLYVTRFSYGRLRGKSFSPSDVGKVSTIPTKLEKLGPRVRGVRTHNEDYETVCKRYDSPDSFFFFDPPYVGTDVNIGESKFDEERFIKLLKSLKGKWLLTYGVHGKLPKLLKDASFSVKTVSTHRSIRTMRGVGGSDKLRQIISYNYDVAKLAKAIKPEAFCDLSDDQLRERLEKLVAQYERETGPREDIVNEALFVMAEMQRRGLAIPDSDLVQAARRLSKQDGYAPIAPSGDKRGRLIKLDEVLNAFQTAALRMPAVLLVGGLANNGETEGDIDLLVRGPFDENTLHEIKFRLGRMLDYREPGLSERIQYLDDDFGGPFTNHVHLFNLVLQRSDKREVIQMAAPLTKAVVLPDKPGPKPAVFQLHARGRSVHGDLRMQINGQLTGWTLPMQRAGAVPDIDTVEDLRKIASGLALGGNRYLKPLSNGRVIATPKKPQPLEWLKMDAKVFEPGVAGATEEEEGVILAVARPKVEYGRQHPYFHEYFFTGHPWFNGVLYLRQIAGAGGPVEEQEAGRRTPAGKLFWTATFGKDLLPSILSTRAVRRGVMPPAGFSWIPQSLEAVVPKELHYWKAKGAKAKELRDELVRSKYFTKDNIKIVDGKFRRVKTVQKMHLTPEPLAKATNDPGISLVKAATVSYALLRQTFKGQTVEREAPSEIVYWLAWESNGGLHAFAIVGNPMEGGGPFTATHQTFSDKKLLKFKGSVEPGTKVGGVNLNPTKATPSDLRPVDSGKLAVVDEEPGLFRLSVKGETLLGVWVVKQEEKGAKIWSVARAGSAKQQRLTKAAGAPVLCFYHNDLDGITAGAIVAREHPKVELRSINYGQDFPWDDLENREIVYMVDFAMQPFTDMVKLKRRLDKQGSRFIWIDHHASALDEAKAAGFECDGLRKNGDAGCELTWRYLHPEDSMPEVVRYAGRFDVWDHSDPNTMLVHYAMEALRDAHEPTSAWWGSWLRKGKGDFGELIQQGKSIAAWLDRFNADKMGATSFEFDWEGLKCVGACTSIPGSMQFESVRKGRDAAVAFGYSPSGQWTVSMYGLKPGVDVAKICAKHGGGGHKGAGGFQCKRLPFELPKEASQTKVSKADVPTRAGVQRWDPKKKDPDVDRSQLRPPAIFAPMKPRDQNAFTKVDELVKEFATAEALKVGLVVEPKWNGRVVVVQSDGTRILYFEDTLRDRSEYFPNLVKGAGKVGQSFVFVGEFMDHDDAGNPLPRRELAEYGVDKLHDDSRVRVKVWDVLYWRGKNHLAEPWGERHKVLRQALPKGVGPFDPTPAKLVHTPNALKAAIKWAGGIPGSEGAMVKLANHTYSLGGHTSSIAKLKATRIINAVVYEKERKKPAPEQKKPSETWIYSCAIGPLTESQAKQMKEVVEVGGKKYTPVGSAFSTNIKAEVGDVLRVEVTEILVVDRPGSVSVTWFQPTVLERVRIKADTVAEVRALAQRHEIRKFCKIIKRDSATHTVLGVALPVNDGEDGAPLDPDAHNHVYSKEEVELAAENWMAAGAQLGIMHQREADRQEMVAVQSYTAPVDFEIDDEPVREGDWLVKARVLSAALWNRFESFELNGWSIDGDGLMQPLERAA
jgi:site-specific DNA-adenine methylase/ATP-dependent DNA ligase